MPMPYFLNCPCQLIDTQYSEFTFYLYKISYAQSCPAFSPSAPEIRRKEIRKIRSP